MNRKKKGKNKVMTIAIIGPGAVGTTLAVELKKVLPDTELIGRQDKLMTYFPENTSNGCHIKVTSFNHINHTFDVIIIAVKTHQLDDVIKQLPKITHDDSLIILAQNGYGQLNKLPYQHVFQAVVYISGQKVNNNVQHFRDYQLYIQDSTLTRQFKQMVHPSKIEVVLQENIEKSIWYKLLVNLGINTITAIGQQPAKILKSPHIESLCRRILVDGLKVARAEQIDFEDHIVDDILNIYKGYPDEMGTSMYYDVINKHPLEVEAIQGYIYKCAKKHHLETPYLDMAYTFLYAYHLEYTQPD